MATFNHISSTMSSRYHFTDISVTESSITSTATSRRRRRRTSSFFFKKPIFAIASMSITQQNPPKHSLSSPNGPLSSDNLILNTATSPVEVLSSSNTQIHSNDQRKTKLVFTIDPSKSSREMIWKLAEAGMNVARLNISHGDHASHQKTIDLIKEFNLQSSDNVVSIMLDTEGPEVRSGYFPQPVTLKEEQEFTIERRVITEDTVSVNYDDFVDDVEVGDILLVDGGMISLAVKSKTSDMVKCVVVDGGELKSRRHLNVHGKSTNLPSITDKDWEDIKFGVDNQVDFYVVCFVKDAKVVHELKDYLKSCNAETRVIVKIESADSVPNFHSIISASDGAMAAHGDLGAELPIEDVLLLQEDLIRSCRSMQKPVIVSTNILESMLNHPTLTRAEVSDIAIAVREGADAVMLSGESAHGKCELFDLCKDVVSYGDAWNWQKEIIREKKDLIERNEECPDTLIVLQHHPVYTLGTGSSVEFLNFDVKDAPFEVYRTERGGEVTYHGPGQIVMYPIINLRNHKLDLHWYLRALEEVVIRVLSSTFSIQASRIPGLTGVWVGDQKVAAIGIKVSHWITYHGLALNVTTDLEPFNWIVPCGIRNGKVGSIKGLLQEVQSCNGCQNIDDDLKLIDMTYKSLIREFSEVFQLKIFHKTTSALEFLEKKLINRL